MRACARCGGSVQTRYRFCPWCSTPLRTKLVEFFRPHALIGGDRGKALRVSRYLDAEVGPHVRFSVWSDADERAEVAAAISLDERESGRLARFLLDADHPGAATTPSPVLRRLVEQLRAPR